MNASKMQVYPQVYQYIYKNEALFQKISSAFVKDDRRKMNFLKDGNCYNRRH